MATRGLPTWPWLHSEATDLPEPERLLLDALRGWAAPGPGGPLPQAAMLLAADGAEAAALPLDALLRALPGLRPGCPLCPRASMSARHPSCTPRPPRSMATAAWPWRCCTAWPRRCPPIRRCRR